MIDDLSPHLQWLRMRLIHYDYEVFYMPRKKILAANFLSRSLGSTVDPESDIIEETDSYVRSVLELSPLSNRTLARIV